MAKITYLGGEETGNVGSIEWSGMRFELNKPVEVTDPYMVAKASNNRFFKVEGVKAKAEERMVEDDKTRAEKESAVVSAQAAYPPEEEEEVDDKAEAEEEAEELPAKRGPGRPRKVKDGDDD